MNKLLTVLAGLMLVASAQAQTADYKWNAELRTRYTGDTNQSFNKSATNANENAITGRAKIGVTMMKGDSLTGHISLLHNNAWGTSNAGVLASGTHNTAVYGNLPLVQEAWGWWKASDMFSMKIGRAALEYGDATLFSVSDWQANPNAWEGAFTQFSFDFADLHVFGTKIQDTVAGAAGNTDPEVVAYGLVFNFKNLPDVLKHTFLTLVQTNADAGTLAGTGFAAAGAQGAGIMHAAVTVMGDVSAIDYRLTYDMVTGKAKAATDTTLASSMMDLEVGFGMPEFMKSRVYVNFHSDTGDDATTTDKIEGYLPLFPDTHKYAGLMDVANWGNLTNIAIGYGLNPADDMNVGIQYHMFSRTTDKGAASVNSAGALMALSTGTSTAIGSEIDIHATKTYGENFSIWALYGIFTPGELLKASNGTVGDAFSRLQLQAKMTF